MSQCQQSLNLALQGKRPQKTQSQSKSPSAAFRSTIKDVHPFTYQPQVSVFSSGMNQTPQRFLNPHQTLNQPSLQFSAQSYHDQDEKLRIMQSPQAQDILQFTSLQIQNPLQSQTRSKMINDEEQDVRALLTRAENELKSCKSENDHIQQKYVKLLREHDETLRQYNESSLKNKMVKFDSSFSSIGDNKTENMLLEENEQLRYDLALNARTLLLDAQQTIIDLRQSIDVTSQQSQNWKQQYEKIQSQMASQQSTVKFNELEHENSQLLQVLKKYKPNMIPKENVSTQTDLKNVIDEKNEALRQIQLLQNSIFLKNELIDQMVIKQGQIELAMNSMQKSKDQEIQKLKATIIEKEEEMENLQVKFIEFNNTILNYK